MFDFFGFKKSQDSKKGPVQEKEVDGFVFVERLSKSGADRERVNRGNDQSGKIEGVTLAQQKEVICTQPGKIPTADSQFSAVSNTAQSVPQTNQTTACASVMPDLLSDVPFTLTPHVQAMQNLFNGCPDTFLSQNFNSLAMFHYDFKLENSVLFDS
ncbi:UBAP1-MVB12-associated (UMA)-domain containing protein 1 isoform X1 [Protopterus annectens]|uniref:UBAP1-MVB12-associated (UMA)-domain containing protein 1 isoform X1 n=1 Tax=Protopterus annectens TaxID=7888 RepID=UPI001CFA2124|nr:UBAP1-MVB12-associated (UMA)-domain containing protein 1 isoform X1 [Protopterus annectens]XP_043922422.1 UBAP1-MVB12-associated (UMA)-domain containing protein 1 isoform X1 [Protopterus annectens]